MGKDASIRFQIPVQEDVADEVARLASILERSQAWMAARLLEEAVRNQSTLSGWLEKFVVGTVGRTVGILARKEKAEKVEKGSIRLQVPVSLEVAERVEVLGKRLNHSQVQMAALLIEWAVADHGWLIELVGSKWGKAVMAKLYARNPEDASSDSDQADSGNRSAA